MKILIADAHPVVRIGLKHHLKQLGDVAFVEAGTGDDAVAALSANRDVTLVICDLAPEGSATDRFKCLRGLRKTNAQVPIIVFSVHEARDIVLKSIDLGARAYLPKSFEEADIIAAVRRVLDGETWVPTRLLQQPATQPELEQQPSLGHSEAVSALTDRQKEVFDLLSQGRSNRQIAASLGVSEHTVRVHMSAILKTLGLKNRTQAAIMASNVKQAS